MDKRTWCGLVIENLAEMDQAIEAISEDEYYKMLENIKPWQRAVSTGFFAKSAAIEAIRYINLGFEDYLIE